MWAGGVTDHLSLEATGAAVIPFGVGNTSRLIETIRGLRPTAISCTPSYAARLELVLREEFSLAPRDLRLQKALFGGEGGLQDPSVRARIEDVWGMQAIDANYGMAEVLSIFGAECPERRGLHFHGQGLLYPELIDPDSLKPLPMAAGRVGELVVTNLIREAQPLIRYRTGDVITILGTEACPCGRRSLRFRVEGRSDDMIVVRGVNVYPSAVSRLLSQRPEWFTGEFEFVLNAPPPIDRPLLRVEVRVDVDSVNRGAIESFLVNACRRQLQFTPITSLIPLGALPRTEGKTKRIRRDY
jgi:phenylacetate-CoA ligase